MAVQTPMLLKIRQASYVPIGFVTADIDPLLVGIAFRYRVVLSVTPQTTSDPTKRQYDGRDVKVGQWFTTRSDGSALKILSIIGTPTATSVTVTAEDENLFNLKIDPSGFGNGIGPNADGVLFELSEVGLPVIGPMAVSVLPFTTQANLQSRFIKEGRLKAGGGGSGVMQDPPFGDITDGAIATWVADETPQSDAINDLNKFLLRISPDQPYRFSEYTHTFQDGSPLINDYIDRTSNNPYAKSGLRLARNVVATGYNAGDYVQAVRSGAFTTTVSDSLWVGNTGTIKYSIDGAVVTTRNLSNTDSTGSYPGGLDIVSNGLKDDVWPEVSVSMRGAVTGDFHTISLEHSLTGRKTIPFVIETAKNPTVTGNLLFNYTGEIVYHSGIPHVAEKGNYAYTVTAQINQCVGTSYPTRLAVINGGLIDNFEIQPGMLDLPAIFNKNHGAFTMFGTFTPTEQAEVESYSGPITITVHSAFESASAPLANVNMFFGPTASNISEGPVGVDEEIIRPKRHLLPTGARPVVPANILYADNYDSTAIYNYEASVVGGKLKFDKTDYRTYFPVGPNLTGKNNEQYACFKLQGVTNNLSLTINGTFDEMYVKLPGVDFALPNTTNGWFDANKQADFAPGSWPGSDFAGDGCLKSNAGGIRTLSFGVISSAFATDNLILIRFVLREGQEITSIYNNV